MRKVTMRSTHYTFHREGTAPHFRVQSDEASAYVRCEFATQAQLLAPAQVRRRTEDNYFDTSDGGSGVTAQQLQLTQGKLHYELPNAIWNRLKTSPNIYFRVSAARQRPADWTPSPPSIITSVSDSNATEGYARFIGVTHDRLLDAPWNFPDQVPLNQVPPYYRTKLTLLINLHETSESVYLLRRLSGHENYTSLPVDQRTKALLVFAATDTPARRALLQLFSRFIPVTSAGGSATPAVRCTDLSTQPVTLLDNLARLVDIYPHIDIPDPVSVLVAEAIEEVADPSFEINQGTKGTCVPTSVSWLIATYFPSEYVRLMSGLRSQGGNVTLANGDQATAPADSYDYDPEEDSAETLKYLRRSWSERLFQASMMSYSRPGMTYRNITDVFSDDRPGLTPNELCRMLQGLRNRRHREITGTGTDLVNIITQRLEQTSLPILTGLQWNPPPKSGGHSVVSVRTDASDVIIRNPWGGMSYRVGQLLSWPTRRTVNPSQAEEAITRADMAGVIISLVVED